LIEQHLKRSVTPPPAQQAQESNLTRNKLRGAVVEGPFRLRLVGDDGPP
jgi:hypothetical protein